MYKASLTIMPHHATFKLFFIVYTWLGMWVILQMLPHESLLRSVAYHQKKDKDLGQTLMIRGPQTEWQYISFPLLRFKIMLPRFYKWQLTLLAYKRWVSVVRLHHHSPQRDPAPPDTPSSPGTERAPLLNPGWLYCYLDMARRRQTSRKQTS